MSQKKVEEYKKSKLNRKDEMKKQKRQSIIAKVCVTVACVAVIGLVGYAFYNNAVKNSVGTDANNVDLSSVNDYLDGLSMDTAMAAIEEETTGEAVSSDAVEEAAETEVPEEE